MTYTVNSGVVAISPVVGEVIMAPVQGATVTTAAAPGTGTRVDVVYAQQRQPASGDSYVVIGVVSFATEAAIVMPENSQELSRFQVSAGQTNTNAAVRLGGLKYSIPYGGSLGVLHKWNNTFNGALSIPLLREGHGTFELPTDRRIKFTMTAVLSAQGASGFDNSKYCEYGWIFNLDGGDHILHTTPGLHQAWGTYQFETVFEVPAGRHTCHVAGTRIVGPGIALLHYGVGGDGYGRRGQEFIVEDLGPIV
jgi:hypothetical protein